MSNNGPPLFALLPYHKVEIEEITQKLAPKQQNHALFQRLWHEEYDAFGRVARIQIKTGKADVLVYFCENIHPPSLTWASHNSVVYVTVYVKQGNL